MQERGMDGTEEAAIRLIGYLVKGVSGDDPTQNNGSSYEGIAFRMEAYSWSDVEQEANFAWRDFKATWYKYLGRGNAVNRHLSREEISEMIEEIAVELREARTNE